jgi:hypothetical protein
MGGWEEACQQEAEWSLQAQDWQETISSPNGISPWKSWLWAATPILLQEQTSSSDWMAE